LSRACGLCSSIDAAPRKEGGGSRRSSLAQELRAAAADRVVSGCFRASLQIGRETGSDALHPVEILQEAYGLSGREDIGPEKAASNASG
jgi:hypothetical protein